MRPDTLLLPDGTSRPLLYGIDVSGWQKTVDFSQVSDDGLTFCFCKATEGLYGQDDHFEVNVDGCRKVGMISGAFHFFHPEHNVVQQAKKFVSVAGARVELPLAIDFETLGNLSVGQAISEAEDFIKALSDLTGKMPIMYLSSGFWMSYPAIFGDCMLWVAEVRSRANGILPPHVPKPWAAWSFHQYAGDPQPGIPAGRCPGVLTNVDLNRFMGTWADLCALAGYGTSDAPTRREILDPESER